jgi:hypothetical protein
MDAKTLMTTWTNVGHHSPLVADMWTLGTMGIIRFTGEPGYGMSDTSDAGAGVARGTLAAQIAAKFRSQQEPPHEDIVFSVDIERRAPGDIKVSDWGNVVLFRPLTDAASAWIERNVGDDAPRVGKSLAVETRFAPYLIEGMVEAGLAFG